MTPQTQFIRGTSAEGLLEQGQVEETPPSQFVGGTSVEGDPQTHGITVRPGQGSTASTAPANQNFTAGVEPAQRQEPDKKTREGNSQTGAKRTDGEHHIQIVVHEGKRQKVWKHFHEPLQHMGQRRPFLPYSRGFF